MGGLEVDFCVCDDAFAAGGDAFCEAGGGDFPDGVAAVEEDAILGGEGANHEGDGEFLRAGAGGCGGDAEEGGEEDGGGFPQGDEGAVEGVEAAGAEGGEGDGDHAGEDGGGGESLWDGCGAGEDVGAAAGDAELAEFLEVEVVCEAGDEGGPVIDMAVWDEGGFSDAGSVHGDEADVFLDGEVVGEAGLEAGGWPAVVVEDGVAGGGAVFVPSEVFPGGVFPELWG